jgi:REP element-mobilizing transposase RayT
MARPLRIEYPGALYHVTCRGNSRGKVFLIDPDRELFLQVLGASRREVQLALPCLLLDVKPLPPTRRDG